MTSLVKYEAARYALQMATQVDEVKDIRDKAQAMMAYARQAKDEDLIKWATTLKLRAERRAGEMLAETPRNNGGGIVSHDTPPLTLEQMGLSADQSSDFQAIATIPEEKFAKALESGKATTASLVRASGKKKIKPTKPVKEAKEPKKDDRPGAEFEPGLAEQLKFASDQVESQAVLLESLRKKDLAAEVEKWKLKFDQLNGRLQQEMASHKECRKQATYATGMLGKIRKALKVEKDRDILEAIRKS